MWLVEMKHAASLVAVAFVLAGCGGGWEGGKTPGIQTVLQIKVWPHGKDRGALREWRLHCDLAGGTHPAPEKACEQLFALASPCAHPWRRRLHRDLRRPGHRRG